MNIAEIAAMAGVSQAAVSRYFNNGYISKEKREAIRKVVEETGYRPSLQAQTLRTKKTRTIGVILPKIDSEVIGRMVAGVVSVLDEKGFRLLLADTQNTPKKELEYLSVFNDKQVDGVILIATVFTPGHKRALKNMSVPVVLAGQHLAGYNCVYHDDYHAMYEMTQRVLGKGRRNLCYIGVLNQDKAAGADRYRGYCDAVKEGKLPGLAEQYRIADFSIESGYEKARELLNTYPGMDALLCATDRIGIGAMQYLKEQGVDIPGQVMVTGQGDSSLTRVTSPTLTTIHYYYEDSGMMAAKMLLESLEKGDLAVKEIKMGYAVVEKESTEGKT